eukprot:1818413-Pyramimonas_sp.AAC.1
MIRRQGQRSPRCELVPVPFSDQPWIISALLSRPLPHWPCLRGPTAIRRRLRVGLYDMVGVLGFVLRHPMGQDGIVSNIFVLARSGDCSRRPLARERAYAGTGVVISQLAAALI